MSNSESIFCIGQELGFPFVLHVDHCGMQVKNYKIPSDKELKHINRKLKSCWGHSSHDEYFLQPYIELHTSP